MCIIAFKLFTWQYTIKRCLVWNFLWIRPLDHFTNISAKVITNLLLLSILWLYNVNFDIMFLIVWFFIRPNHFYFFVVSNFGVLNLGCRFLAIWFDSTLFSSIFLLFINVTVQILFSVIFLIDDNWLYQLLLLLNQLGIDGLFIRGKSFFDRLLPCIDKSCSFLLSCHRWLF